MFFTIVSSQFVLFVSTAKASKAGLGAAPNQALSCAARLRTAPGTRTAPPELQPGAAGALFSPEETFFFADHK